MQKRWYTELSRSKIEVVMNDANLFKGLQQLSKSAFPKKCSGCGKVYETLEQFLSETRDIRNSSGLMSSLGEEEQSIVEVYRNCSCGSTLMDFCQDRRDSSASGLKKRKLFDELLEKLVQRGIPSTDAHEELLNLIHGRPCPILSKLGLKSLQK